MHQMYISLDNRLPLWLQGAGEMGRYVCPPLPPYLDDSQPVGMDLGEGEEPDKRPLYDICFHLLQLYSDRWASPLIAPSIQLLSGGVGKRQSRRGQAFETKRPQKRLMPSLPLPCFFTNEKCCVPHTCD